MDEKIGICPICGGFLFYIHCLNMIKCDTCEYEELEVNK